jgi:pimeloyl-ACP methyl ester carboxylesterase
VQPGEKVDHAADLAGLIQGLGLEKPVVGGHSMGAGTAAYLEARFPGLAGALVLEDPGWRTPEPPSLAEQAPKEPPRNPFAEWLLSLKGKTLAEVEAKGRVDTPTWAEIEWPAWAESKLQLDTTLFQTEGTWRDWTEVAQAIRCPTLLLTADPEKGSIVTPEAARQAVALSSQIQVVRIPGAGHNIRRENYPAFMQALRQFLKTL